MKKKLLLILLCAVSESATLLGASSPNGFDDSEIAAATALLKQKSNDRLHKGKTPAKRRRAKSTSPSSLTQKTSLIRPQIQKYPLRSGPHSPTRTGSKTSSPSGSPKRKGKKSPNSPLSFPTKRSSSNTPVPPGTLTPPSPIDYLTPPLSNQSTPQTGESPETIFEEILYLPGSTQTKMRATSPLERTPLPSLHKNKGESSLLTYLKEKMEKMDTETVKTPSPKAALGISKKPDNFKETSVTQGGSRRLFPIHKSLPRNKEEVAVVEKTATQLSSTLLEELAEAEKEFFNATPKMPKRENFLKGKLNRRGPFTPLPSARSRSMFDLSPLSTTIEEESEEELPTSIFNAPATPSLEDTGTFTVLEEEEPSEDEYDDDDVPEWKGALQRAYEKNRKKEEQEKTRRKIKNHYSITLPRARKELKEITISEREPQITFAPKNLLEKVREYEPTFNEMKDMHGEFKKSESGKLETQKKWIKKFLQY